MSRPRYERTYFEMPDISVRLSEESYKRLCEVIYEAYGYGNNHLSYKRITEDTGITRDVIRHFIRENHIRYLALETLCRVLKEKVGFKTIIKERR